MACRGIASRSVLSFLEWISRRHYFAARSVTRADRRRGSTPPAKDGRNAIVPLDDSSADPLFESNTREPTSGGVVFNPGVDKPKIARAGNREQQCLCH